MIGHLPKTTLSEKTVVVVGNPNVGKTTLINALAGTQLKVGNWSGVTVEKREAHLFYRGKHIHLIDLPGAYSLNPHTPEELITRTALLDEPTQLIINVLDAGNLERNLYLTLQLLEFECPMVIALNLMDEAESKGLTVEAMALQERLGIPVVATVASSGIGVKDLLQHMGQIPPITPLRPKYPEAIEHAVTAISGKASEHPLLLPFTHRYLALTLLEGDGSLRSRLKITGHTSVAEEADRQLENLTDQGSEPLLEIAEVRYQLAHQLSKAAIPSFERRRTLTDRLDGWLLHPYLGIPIFLALMLLTFRITFSMGGPFVDFIAGPLQEVISGWTASILKIFGAPDVIHALLLGAIIPGVGTVLAFVPTLLVLYLAMSFLEDSGYMARAAFLVDRLMRSVGLEGKAFIPMVLGFGCNVPAVYATRTLDQPRTRLITTMILPFMSCSARLPVYVIFSAALFGKAGSWVVWGMYVLGTVVALAFSAVFSRRSKDLNQTGILELPPYRLPYARVLWKHGSNRTKSFIRRAGTTVFSTVVIVWLTLSIPLAVGDRFAMVDPESSLFGGISHWISPIFAPAGFDNWQATGALIPGFVAKEVVIGTLGQIYLGEQITVSALGWIEGLKQLGNGLLDTLKGALSAALDLLSLPSLSVDASSESQNPLVKALANAFSPASGLAYLVFVLLYTPCIATVGAIAGEQGKKIAWITVGYQLVTAWALAVLTYQVAKWFI